MTQMLTQHGKSLALVIDPSLLAQLHIDATTPLEVKADGGRIMVTPQRSNGEDGDISDAEFDAAASEITQRYEKTFRKLAE